MDKEYDPLKLENQLCFPLYACAKEVVRKYRQPLSRLHLTYTQYIVMLTFWEYGNMTVKELGHKVHLDSGTLTPLLKRLEKQGLVLRTRSENDERNVYISLTEPGKALKEKAKDVPAQMMHCLNLSMDEMAELKQLLDKALIGMEKEYNDL